MPSITVSDSPEGSGPYAGLVDYLAYGYWSDQGGTWHKFDVAPGGRLTYDMAGLDPATAEGRAGRQYVDWALEAWSAVTGIDFVEVRSGGQIGFDDSGSGAGNSLSYVGHTIRESEVRVSASRLPDDNVARIDSQAMRNYVHEIGHALGLGHAGHYDGDDDETAMFVNDSWQASVMSYLSQLENTSVDADWARNITPQVADILAIQKLYGAPTDVRSGNTRYGDTGNTGGWLDDAFALEGPVTLTLFDTGGIDTIDLRSDTSDQVVSLAPGGYSTVNGVRGSLGIAAGTVIENMMAGSGDDRVDGNFVANRLSGGDGDDRLRGLAGDDLLQGGTGDDVLQGNAGADRLQGQSGRDYLAGGAGNDVLQGGSGNDVLIGGTGIDTADYSAARGGVAVDLRIDGGQRVSAVEGVDVLREVENLRGSAMEDRLVGDAAANSLSGLGGGDTLFGLAGNDVLTGGAGGDRLYGGAGADRLFGGAGNDRLYGGTGGDVIDGGAGYDTVDYGLATGTGVRVDLRVASAQSVSGTEGNDVLRGIENVSGSGGNDRLVGDAAGNILWGQGGDDLIFGLAGADRLAGGAGYDRLIGGAGTDRFWGGAGADRFLFLDASDSAPGGARDVIHDFQDRLDRVHLHFIDADEGRAGNQAFTFVGRAGFTGTAGELRFGTDGTDGFVLADTDGDGRAEFGLTLLGVTSMDAFDFVL